MAGSIRRLEGLSKVISVNVRFKLTGNNFLYDFAKEPNVRDWAIVFQFVFIERWFLQNRCNGCITEGTWKNASTKRGIDCKNFINMFDVFIPIVRKYTDIINLGFGIILTTL